MAKLMIRRVIAKLTRYLNRKSTYPMVIESWSDLKSVEVLQSVIDSGFFRKCLRPTEPDLSLFENIVVIAPHQDDEAIGCGGLLAKLSGRAGITVLFMTDGSQRVLGVSESDSVALRNEEAISALKCCNASQVNLGFANESLGLTSQHVERLEGAIKSLHPKPDLILAPWFFDRPQKHRICNVILLETLQRLTEFHDTPLWGYQVHNCLFPNVVVDISTEMESKLEMIRCYSSQIDKVASYDHFISGMNQWNAHYLSPKCKGFAEIFCALPVREWLEIYEKLVRPQLSDYVS